LKYAPVRPIRTHRPYPASVRTVLVTGLHVAGVPIHPATQETGEEPPWS
jgi:hypothetical protein